MSQARTTCTITKSAAGKRTFVAAAISLRQAQLSDENVAGHTPGQEKMQDPIHVRQ